MERRGYTPSPENLLFFISKYGILILVHIRILILKFICNQMQRKVFLPIDNDTDMKISACMMIISFIYKVSLKPDHFYKPKCISPVYDDV